jgi:putative ABC transport system ATP-binding protein
VILDISGDEKKHLTVEMLMNAFTEASGEAFANDRILLS